MTYSSIAYRSLKYEPKRYILLFFAASLGIALAIVAFGLMNGMMNALHNKARIYYGGDMMLLQNTNGSIAFYNTTETINKLEPYFNSKDILLSSRIDVDLDEMYFIYEGVSIKQRKLKGVDFTKEGVLFDTLNFVEGDAKNIQNTNGVLISISLAELLNVHVGDNITLLFKTTNNFTNTANLVVKGIFKDSSIFGANVSYLDIDFLRSIRKYPVDYSISIGIFSKDGTKTTLDPIILQEDLQSFFDMHPLVIDKDTFIKNPHKTKGKTALITLDANMQDIAFLILALRIIIYVIIAILIVIIAIGIGSTYKVIAVKRTNEIGMYMALGLSPYGIIKLFMIEVFYLMLLAFVCSLFIMLIMASIISSLDFTQIPAFDIFLMNGKLLLQPNFLQIFLIFAIVVVTTMTLVYFTIRKCVNINPVDALSVTE